MRHLLVLILISVLMSCGTDRLENEFEVFEGQYEWISTGASKNAWTHASIDTDRTSYTIQLELDDAGHIRFLKDHELISEHKYRIVDKETNQYGGAMIMLQLKGNTDHLDLSDDRISLHMSGDTGLTADRFPFPAIDKAHHYYQDYYSTNNSFHR